MPGADRGRAQSAQGVRGPYGPVALASSIVRTKGCPLAGRSCLVAASGPSIDSGAGGGAWSDPEPGGACCPAASAVAVLLLLLAATAHVGHPDIPIRSAATESIPTCAPDRRARTSVTSSCCARAIASRSSILLEHAAEFIHRVARLPERRCLHRPRAPGPVPVPGDRFSLRQLRHHPAAVAVSDRDHVVHRSARSLLRADPRRL